MSEILEPRNNKELEKRQNRAIRASFIIGITYIIFFGFALLAIIRQGYIDWTDAVLTPLVGVIVLLSFFSVTLIREDQYTLGTNIIFLANLLPPLTVSIILRDISVLSSAYILFSSFFLAFFILEKKSRRFATISVLFVVILSILIDILDPSFQIGTGGLENFAPFVIGITVIALFILSIRQISRLRGRTKLMATVFFTIIITVFFQTGRNLKVSRISSEEADRHHLHSLFDNYSKDIEIQENASAAIATTFADRDDIKNLFLTRDRIGLLELLTPVFSTLEKDYAVRHLYIEDAEGIVFVRVHNPSKFGDDITYRLTAAGALEKKETVSGVEVGPSRIGIRSVSPLWYKEEFIGMVEVGLDYDQEFVNGLKKHHGADYNLWISYEAAEKPGLIPPYNAPTAPTEKVFYYIGTNPLELPIEANVYDQVLESGVPITQFISVNGEEYGVIIAPMIGYGGKIIGIIEILESRSDTLALLNSNRQAVLLPAILFTLLGLLSIGFIITKIVLHPLDALRETAEKQIAGNLSARVTNFPPDEFGALGKTFNNLSEQLENTLKKQEEIITERTQNLEKRTAYLETSVEVSQAIAEITDTEKLIWEVVSLIKKRFDLYYVGVFRVDKENKWAFLKAGTGEAGKTMLAENHRLEIGKGMIGWSVANAQARIALDVGKDAIRFDNPLLPETRSEGALPLRSRGRVLGAITIQSREPAAFNQEIIDTLQIMADQIAIALDNAELITQSEQSLKAERIAYGELSHTDWLAVLQRDQAPHYISDAPNTVHPLKIYAPARDTQSLPTKVTVENEGLTAIIPIKVRGHVLGGVKLRKEQSKGAWTKEELSLAQYLVERPLSVALEGARLYDQSQRRAARERIIGEASAKMRETLDIEGVLETAAQEFRNALGASKAEVWVSTDETQAETTASEENHAHTSSNNKE